MTRTAEHKQECHQHKQQVAQGDSKLPAARIHALTEESSASQTGPCKAEKATSKCWAEQENKQLCPSCEALYGIAAEAQQSRVA